MPVVRALAALGPVSVDTMRASVAEAALEAGATVINDVSGGLADPALLPLVAAAGCPVVLMHWRGPSADMQSRASYDDVVAEVHAALAERVLAAVAAGVEPSRIALDPGLGFGKTGDHNWALLRGLPRLQDLGHPLLVGASRKSFLGDLLGGRPAGGRDAATAALTAVLAGQRVWAVRVHDVASSADAVRVVERMSA